MAPDQDARDAGDDLAPWLAAATDGDLARVETELAEGERRRAFVVDELLEAGFTGHALLDLVLRLTGVGPAEAEALIAARERLVDRERVETPKRDRRLAENEMLFRAANERVSRLSGSDPPSVELDVICECADRGCLKLLTIERSEYEWLRQNPWRFVVLPGHEAPAVEDVVERHRGYLIVEKHVETHDQVEAEVRSRPTQPGTDSNEG
jgi:hypothetical protein